MFPNVGMGELVVILLVVLLLFGAKRLPEVAKGLGRSVKSFKEGLRDGIDEPASDDVTHSAEARPKDDNKKLLS